MLHGVMDHGVMDGLGRRAHRPSMGR